VPKRSGAECKHPTSVQPNTGVLATCQTPRARDRPANAKQHQVQHMTAMNHGNTAHTSSTACDQATGILEMIPKRAQSSLKPTESILRRATDTEDVSVCEHRTASAFSNPATQQRQLISAELVAYQGAVSGNRSGYPPEKLSTNLPAAKNKEAERSICSDHTSPGGHDPSRCFTSLKVMFLLQQRWSYTDASTSL
jgi:hypothetical protein